MKQSGTLIRCGILSVVFVLFCMCFTTALHTQPVYAADHVMQQEIVDGPNTPSENNAYIIFSDSPREHKMSFEDGVGTDRYKNETYNEKITVINRPFPTKYTHSQVYVCVYAYITPFLY